MTRSHARFAVPLLLSIAGCSSAPDPGALEKARIALARHDPAAAREVLLPAMKAGLATGEAHLLNGRALLDMYEAAAAEAEFSKALAAGASGAAVAPLIGEALFVQGRGDEALARLKAARPGDVEAERIRARILAAAGDMQGAALAFDKAVKDGGQNAAALADRAQFRLATGRTAQSLADAQRAVQLDGRDPDILIVRGIVERVASPKASLVWFDRATKVAPDNILAKLQKAATLDQLGRRDEAAELANQILQARPRHPIALAMLAHQRLRRGDASGARDLIQRAGAAAESTPTLMLASGEAEFRLGNHHRAIDTLNRLVSREPGNASARRILAASLWAVGDAAAVPEVLRPVVERPDADRFSLALMARALGRVGKADQGQAYLIRASLPEVSPGVRPAQADVSTDERTRGVRQIQAFAAGGKFEAAEAAARQLAGREPQLVEAQVLLGDALMAQSQFAAAVPVYRRAADLSFTEPVARRLAAALEASGKRDAARSVADSYFRGDKRPPRD